MDCAGQKGAPSSSSSYASPVDDLSCSSISDTGSEQDWLSPTSAAKRARVSYDGYAASGPSSSTASNPQQLLGHADQPGSHRGVADDDRRKVRRERNKLAAARCRQRRVDLTNTLMAETEALEGEKIRLEREIESLYRQTNELQYVLDSHCKRCQMTVDTGRSTMTVADPLPAPVDLTSIKTERPDGSSSQRMIPGVFDAKFGFSRPNSLPISSSLALAGGGMDTPQFSGSGSVVTPCSMTLDFMADGHTGLTPITGMPSAAEGPSSIDCLPSTQTLMNL